MVAETVDFLCGTQSHIQNQSDGAAKEKMGVILYQRINQKLKQWHEFEINS